MNKFCFLLPAYKGKYLKIALDSILNQTYSEFDLIILDDCSPENLKLIVDKYVDKRISYYRNAKNMGAKSLVSCWNKLLSFTKSEYIIMASDDDVYSPYFLEEINKLIDLYPCANLFRARAKTINDLGQDMLFDIKLLEYVDSLQFIAQLYSPNVIRCIANYVIKREQLEKIGRFVDFPLAWFSDDATAILLSKLGVVNTEKILFSFRCSKVNITGMPMNPMVGYGKSMAAIDYDNWFRSQIQETEKSARSTSAKALLEYILYMHEQYVNSMIIWPVQNCKVKDFLHILRRMNGGWLKYQSVSLYILSKITRILNNK